MKNKPMNIEQLAQEYEEIGILKQISDSEVDRLDKILEIAESNYDLNRLINEIDLRLAQEQELLDPENMNYIENQRVKLIKSIGVKKDKNKSLSLLLF